MNATTSGASTSTSSNVPSSSRSTGAAGSIKDKIGKFQANAESNPLVPVGSFGLGGARREPSSIEGNNNMNKSRVASLGGGSFGSVRTGGGRSSLAGIGSSNSSSNAGSSKEENLDNTKISSNPSSSRSSSVDGHSNGSSNITGYKTPTDSTPPQSTSPPSSADILDELPIRTGPGSISSMNVETGSVDGDSSVQESGTDTPTTQSAYASPVSSPIVEPSHFSHEPNPMNLNDNEIHDSYSTLKGPVALLREPSRTQSIVSVSSMLVEDGSQATEGVANLSEVDHIDLNQKSEEKGEIPTSVGEVADLSEAPELHERSEEIEKLREEQTKKELKRYEEETEDATVIPGLPSMETRQSTTIPLSPTELAPAEVEESEVREERILKTPEPTEEFQPRQHTPVLSTFGTLDDGSPEYATSVRLNSLSSEHTTGSDFGSYKDGERRESAFTSSLTPKSEASELGEDDPLLSSSARGSTVSTGGFQDISINQPEMHRDVSIHHEVSVVPPSPGMPKVKCNDCSEEVDLMELADHTCAPSFLPPAISSPLPPSPKSLSSISTSQNHSDVPLSDDDEPEIAGAFPSPRSTRFTTLSPSRSAWASTSSPTSVEAQESPTTLRKKSLASSRLDSFVPQSRNLVPDDVEEDDDEFFKSNSLANHGIPDSPVDSNFPSSFTYMTSLVGSNRMSQVSQTSSGGSSTRDVSGWGSRSSLGGVPGVDDDENEEQDYEGGSVTIVRSTASHRIDTQP